MPEIVVAWLMTIYDLALKEKNIEYYQQKPAIIHVAEVAPTPPPPQNPDILYPGDLEYDRSWCISDPDWMTTSKTECDFVPYNKKTHKPAIKTGMI